MNDHIMNDNLFLNFAVELYFTGGNGIACCGPVGYLCGKLL